MELGFDPERFWHITPRELQREIVAAIKRLKREHAENAWLAWHVEALARTKELPSLDVLLGKEEPQQTAEEIDAILQGWTAERVP